MHQCEMFLPLSPLCIPVFIVCQTQCSTSVHHVCISVTSRFFQVFHTPLFWRSGIAARFCCPASNPAVPSCLYLFIGVVTSFAINTNFAVWILGMHFYWDRGSTCIWNQIKPRWFRFFKGKWSQLYLCWHNQVSTEHFLVPCWSFQIQCDMSLHLLYSSRIIHNMP